MAQRKASIQDFRLGAGAAGATPSGGTGGAASIAPSVSAVWSEADSYVDHSGIDSQRSEPDPTSAEPATDSAHSSTRPSQTASPRALRSSAEGTGRVDRPASPEAPEGEEAAPRSSGVASSGVASSAVGADQGLVAAVVGLHSLARMLAEDGCTEGEKQHQMRLSNSSETSGEQSPPIHLGETSVQRKSREARAGSSPSAKAWTAGRGATSLLAAAERRASLFTELAAAEERLVASAAAEVEASEAAAATNARASAMVSRAARAARAAGGHARTPLGRAGSGELSPGSRTATFERGAAHRNSGDARSAAPPLASGGGEAAILGDGKWIFGRVLPPDSLESAAWVALELLRAAPSCGSSAEGRASVLLVTHVCLPSLRALETAEPPLVDGTATTSLRPASPNATSSPGSTRVGLAAAAATPATAPDSGTTAEASPRPAQGVAGAPASFGQALLSARASDGATLLIAAAAAGATPLVQALLNGERRRGEQVDPYAKTDGGSTALHAAAMGSHRETCALLLASTGLPLGGQTAADSLGRTPLDVCPPRFREELVELRSETDASVDKRGVLLHRPLLSSAAQLLAGRYHVHTRIGQKVVLAEDVVRHRPVALKFAQTRERLEAEASVLGIVGPEVAPEVFDSLYDEAGEGGQQHVLVMQAADPNYYTPSSCSELAHFCSRPREGIEVRTHAQRLLQCVLALHDRGLVHADLKVQHFLRFSGEWKLVDFDNVLSEGTECVPSCTVRYAAPEVAASRLEATPMRVTAAVDVWAMALILYELFAGRPLVDDLTLVDLARVPETAVVAKLAEDSLLHTAQKRLLLDMLQVEPEARGRTLRVPPSPSAAASHVGAVPPPLALGPSTTPPCCSAASFSHVGGASSPSTSRAALREVRPPCTLPCSSSCAPRCLPAWPPALLSPPSLSRAGARPRLLHHGRGHRGGKAARGPRALLLAPQVPHRRAHPAAAAHARGHLPAGRHPAPAARDPARGEVPRGHRRGRAADLAAGHHVLRPRRCGAQGPLRRRPRLRGC